MTDMKKENKIGQLGGLARRPEKVNKCMVCRTDNHPKQEIIIPERTTPFTICIECAKAIYVKCFIIKKIKHDQKN